MSREPSATIAGRWGGRQRRAAWSLPAEPLPAVPLLPAFDWRRHQVGYVRSPCRICGRGAFCKDEDGAPCHKVCAERLLVKQVGLPAAVEWAGQQVRGKSPKKRRES